MRSRLPDRPYTDSPLGFNRHIFPEVIIMGFPLRILTSVSSAFKKALVRVVLINKEKKKRKKISHLELKPSCIHAVVKLKYEVSEIVFLRCI